MSQIISGVKIAVIIIDLIGITIGVGAIVMMRRLKETIGGKVGEAITYFMLGVSCMVASFVYTLFNVRLDTALKGSLNVLGADVHHGLMVVGMIFFILSARKFVSMV